MRILAVDHDPIVHETLVQLLLQDVRFDAVAAMTSDAAITLLKDRSEAPFDCILLCADVVAAMDVMSIVRARKRHAKTPIIVLADLQDGDVLDAAISPEVTDYLAKPFALDTLVERLLALKAPTKTGPVTPAPKFDAPVPLAAKLRVFDAKGFTEMAALENYAKQLPRNTLYTASAFGLSIREIDALHGQLTPFDFHALINDVASVIAEELKSGPCLMAYAGDGIFVGIAESDWRAQTTDLMRRVNTRIDQMPLRDGDDAPLDVKLSAGQAVRLTWKSSNGIVDALSQARHSAATARAAFGKLRNQFWFLERSA